MNKNNDIVVKNGQKLRCGYTTGSCAAAATAAATEMILSGQQVEYIKILLPSSNEVLFEVTDINIGESFASCSVQKDAGDDPDITDGIKIFSSIKLCEEGMHIKGGDGVGLVTSKGLKCEVGEPAINPVPKKMIIQNAQKVCEKYSYNKGLEITISAQNGEETAKKTFNPRLGIVGGISILGTTGIVEPMSEKALIDTIKVLINKQKMSNEKLILISPGNYGREYCKNVLHIDIDKGIKFSNYIGETLDYLVYSGFEKVLLVGHIGKLVKIAGGIMNTHSLYADCRMEIFAAHSAMAGADRLTIKRLMNSKTTDEAIEIIEEAGLEKQVFASIKDKIQFYIDYRTKGSIQVEFYIFSTNGNIIIQTENADKYTKQIRGIEDEG